MISVSQTSMRTPWALWDIKRQTIDRISQRRHDFYGLLRRTELYCGGVFFLLPKTLFRIFSCPASDISKILFPAALHVHFVKRFVRPGLNVIAPFLMTAIFPVSILMTGISLTACSQVSSDYQNGGDSETAAPEYVGLTTCASCHQAEMDAWTGSHHDLAMQAVSDSTVLGNFNTSTFVYNQVLTTFFRKDGDYYVNTDGPDGKLNDYKVTYVFGVEPLQQYLIAFPGGRLQALGIAWDTRAESDGGQRWFHLYADEVVNADSPLHWTGPNQNWNYMCADCHSTNLQKNYDVENNRYQTDWSEVNVSCEACHGPASNHVDWALSNERANEGTNARTNKRANEGTGMNSDGTGREITVGQTNGTAGGLSNGLVVQLPKAGDGSVIMNTETGIARLEGRTKSHVLLNTCAPCHSRRSRIAKDFLPGRPLMSSHRPSLLREDLYFADGQVRDEVYVYGSFVQSKMYSAGVVCSDCHDSHSLKLRAQGNALCASCHAPDKFDSSTHTKHKAGTDAAQCVTCHMPERTFMVVDPRRDHSFTVPRPDLARRIFAPDVCTSCHTNQTATWASDRIAEFYGTDRRTSMHFGEALSLARQQAPGAAEMLVRVANDPLYPAIARGTALSLMRGLSSRESPDAISRALSDDDPLVRFGAVTATEYFSDRDRLFLLYPLLSDSILVVRTEAARVLASVRAEFTSAVQRKAIERGAEEYITAERVQEERPEAWMNVALIQSALRRFTDAENSYRRALNLNPKGSAAYVNLADLYRLRMLEPESEQILRDGLARIPGDAAINHALGLSLVRQQRSREALPLLKTAADNAPENPRFIYVYAIAANSTGASEEALAALTTGITSHPNDLDILMSLATINRDIREYETALLYARRLQLLIPGDPNVGSLVLELQVARRQN